MLALSKQSAPKCGDGGIRTHEARKGLGLSKPVQLATMRRLLDVYVV